MSEFTFSIKTPEDLLAKLHRECLRCNEALKNWEETEAVDHAVNFVITGWSMVDWAWSSDAVVTQYASKGAFKKETRRNPEMNLCADLANGAKHFLLDRGGSEIKATTASKTDVRTSGVLRPVMRPVMQPVLRGPMEGPVIGSKLSLFVHLKDGKRQDINTLFEAVTNFWEVYLSNDS